MAEHISYPEAYIQEADSEKRRLLQYVAEMERELMRMKRTEKVLLELEQRYLALMDSSVFLCVILGTDGRFRAMNRRAEEFFGFQIKFDTDVTLQSFAGPGHAGEVDSMLGEAMDAPLHSTLPVMRGGAIYWLDVECAGTLYQGSASVQMIASDITGFMNTGFKNEKAGEPEPGPARPDTEFLAGMELFDSAPRMLLVLDDDSRCVEVNANFLKVLKLTRDEAVDRSFEEFLAEGDPINDGLPFKLSRALREKSFEDLECKVAGKNGDILSLSLSGSRLTWGGEPRVLVSCADNTRLRRAVEQLKRVSSTDVSTGALNRQGMERVLGAEIERAVRYRGSLAMIILDVDGFRQLNERLGYAASDRILKELASTVKSRIRLTDFLGRWGGDEFMVLTPLPLATAAQLAEQLRDMAQHAAFAQKNGLTLSAGVAGFSKSMDISAFVGAAYDAMIEAKRSGGNRTVQAKENKEGNETE